VGIAEFKNDAKATITCAHSINRSKGVSFLQI